ncbi:MAG TPA: thiamine pyrophosphate-dependent enzyme [Armatimonadota bacterium]|nr:thiamine pyrophosphate-dependent enzyme [Armatimonadota bacterium]
MAKAKQTMFLGNGNDAAAQAVLHIGYDGEGYYPITPSSEVGEIVSKAVAAGQSDISFIVGTSELAAIGICTGMAVAGGRVVDVTSAQGLLLKAEELPVISGMGLPMVLNLSCREISAPLNIKNGHTDLVAALGWGWLILMAPNVQAVYDMNIIAIKLAEAVNLPAIVAYDGFHTSHANRRIEVFENPAEVAEFVGPVPARPNVLDLKNPMTFGSYMNDDLINTRVNLEQKMAKAYEILPQLFAEYAELTGRNYNFVEVTGDQDAEAGMFILNSAAEAAKIVVKELKEDGKSVKLVEPYVLRPFPAKEIVEAIGDTKRLVVAERASQYGAGNYLENEVAAALHKAGKETEVIGRVYGLGGLNFRPDEDARPMFELALNWPNVDESQKTLEGRFWGAWSGDPDYKLAKVIEPMTTEETTWNAGQTKVDLKQLSNMPERIEKHTACPGCGIMVNISNFLRGIDGQTVLMFNTGCGMIVSTGFPLTSHRMPYVHNLFHNASSTATGIVEMYHRFRAQGKIPDEEITFICISGDGGDDIGMDQLIGSALRNDPIIFLEYDNKGYMNTGGQLCYSGLLGQRNSNAYLGPKQHGKQTQHKDIVEILRGTNAPYLFTAAESNARDIIAKARKAQATVRNGGFAFGKFFSTCPLNWGSDPARGNEIVDRIVKSCIHPLYEIENGVTTLSYDPEKANAKIPVTEAFKIMGGLFSHLSTEKYAAEATAIQEEVDRRWARLKAHAENEIL